MDMLCEPPFSLPQTFDAVDEAIDANADIAEAILATGLAKFSNAIDGDLWKGTAAPNDVDKARSTIRQLYRDWSAEGRPERYASHSAIINALMTNLRTSVEAQHRDVRILVPGAGLGRLVYELGAAGYIAEGNELSYHQLIASTHIFRTTRGQHTLYPWALSFNNHLTRANQLQSVKVPDVQTNSNRVSSVNHREVETSFVDRMSMTSGDFCDLYREPHYAGTFDAVATCFFVDTAANVITYIETIQHCLKVGGIWVNTGPLLWHFEAAPPSGSITNTTAPAREEPGSFELSNDEVVALVERFGFDIVEHKQAPATGYIQDPHSMLQNVYKPAWWLAKKR
ncbi:hypothetical protein LTR97_002785 [Elasticomyces elasticus]|uniref:carnosine N-methyltransferase n=1 Tax=Elasticomyces elasticus TaxID=574655 RepID=A0AAN7W955_9PEZI|nr:hypothetical protein LTR97_002785 [Elasticomyces elasticus]